jgi:putative transcriptional regulator
MKQLDFSFKNKLRPRQGVLLLSDPFLKEDYFTRSVVLLCEHNENGSFGLVLNNYIDIKLHQLDSNFPESDNAVSIGGPVDEQSIYYLHSFGDSITDSLFVDDHISFGGDFEQIKNSLVAYPSGKVLFFLGYSGWSPGQLNEELALNSWLIVNNIPLTEVYNQHTDLWKYCMEKQGEQFRVMSNFPINPQSN